MFNNLLKNRLDLGILKETHVFIICILSIIILFAFGLTHAEEKRNDVLEFKISVIPGVERYINLLEYPPFLAVALQNNGIKPSSSYFGGISIIDRYTMKTEYVVLRFIKKNELLFAYQARAQWELANKTIYFDLKAEIDNMEIKKGVVIIRVYKPSGIWLPEVIVERISNKVKAMTDKSIQEKMLIYFNALETRLPEGSGIERMLELILIDSYNISAKNYNEGIVRETSINMIPKFYQILLLLILTILLLIVPLYFLKNKRSKKE